MLNVQSSQTILELGSGCGFGTRHLASQCKQVLACDISPAYLSYARKHCADLDTIDYLQVNSRSLAPVENNSVDGIVSISVFIHLNLYDIYWYFQEFARVLRPGGRVCFDFADSEKLFRRHLLRPAISRSYQNNFCEQAEFYRNDPHELFQLMQWNSASSIINIARNQGFRFVRRRSDRLLFERANK